MKSRILWSLAASVFLLSACSESPSSPARITTIAPGALKVQAPTRNTGTLGPALGAGSATNSEDITGWFTLVVFEFGDGVNQIDRGRFTIDAAPGQTVPLSTGVEGENDCTTYQVDVFWMMPRAARYTISDTVNYPPVVSRMVYPKAACRLPPSPPVTPPPSCDTFTMQHNYNADDWIMSAPPSIVPSGIPGVWPYPSSVGPRSLALTGGIPAGTYHFTAKTDDPYHLSAPDDTPINEHEMLRFRFDPSGLETLATHDIATNEIETVSEIGDLTFLQDQTAITAVHAGPVGDVAMDSLRPDWVRWSKLCR